MWESITFAAVLIILRGMRSGPVALFGFNDFIISFACSVVASGKSKMGFFLICLNDAGVISIVFSNFTNSFGSYGFPRFLWAIECLLDI